MVLPDFLTQHLQQKYKSTARSEHQLLYLFCEITRKCNLTCIHCGSDCTAQTDSPELTTDSWIAILENIASAFNPPPVIVLTGGEPILHPDFSPITKKIKSLNMEWGLVSNGYQLNKQMLDQCIDNGIGSITISLDGQEQAHEWLRGKRTTFKRTMMALDLIAASTIPLMDVVTCVHPHNLSELDSIASLLINTGIPAWRLFRIFPAGRAKDNPDLQLTVEQTRQLINWIRERKPSLAKKGLDVQLSCEGWLPTAIDRQVRNQPFFCRAGINIASILSDGTITGCSNNASRFYEGNILNDSFPFVWQNRFSSFRDRSWVKNTECGTCQHSRHCVGGSIHLWRENELHPDFCYADCFR